jgi:hypothetical protein
VLYQDRSHIRKMRSHGGDACAVRANIPIAVAVSVITAGSPVPVPSQTRSRRSASLSSPDPVGGGCPPIGLHE